MRRQDDTAVIDLVRVRRVTSLAQVRAELAERERRLGPRAAALYVARETKFWHHDPLAVKYRLSPEHGLGPGVLGPDAFTRRGPRGEHVAAFADWRGVLNAVEANPHHFGPGGLAVFEAAHGDNCLHPFEPRAWSAFSWAAYAHALKRQRRTAA